MDQGRSEHCTLPHAMRITLRQIVDEFMQLKQIDHLGNARGRLSARQSVHVGNELQELATSQLLVEEGLVRDVTQQLPGTVAVAAQVVPADGNGAGSGEKQAA